MTRHERPRPLGDFHAQRLDALDPIHQHEQRLGLGAALDAEDALHGLGVERVGTEAVEALRGEGHEATGLEHRGGLSQRGGQGLPRVHVEETRHGDSWRASARRPMSVRK